jgi:hypothetical protein
MQRRYEYIQKLECVGMGAAMSALTEGVHERNLKAKADAKVQFELARRDQVKIGARLRKTKERDRNEETYGKRKKPKQTGTDRTPRTGAARAQARMQARTGETAVATLADTPTPTAAMFE